jgi:hypothetical protein
MNQYDYCGRCGAKGYKNGICPNCKQIDAMNRQTKLQAKQFKSQAKMQSGGGGGGGAIAGVVEVFLNFFLQAFALTLKLFWKIYVEMFRFLGSGIKALYDRNPQKFMKVVKTTLVTVAGMFGLLMLSAFVYGMMQA